MAIYKDIVAELERLETRLGAVEKAASRKPAARDAAPDPEVAQRLGLVIERIDHLLKEAGHEPG